MRQFQRESFVGPFSLFFLYRLTARQCEHCGGRTRSVLSPLVGES
jgi:hypothetical protein